MAEITSNDDGLLKFLNDLGFGKYTQRQKRKLELEIKLEIERDNISAKSGGELLELGLITKTSTPTTKKSKVTLKNQQGDHQPKLTMRFNDQLIRLAQQMSRAISPPTQIRQIIERGK